MFSGQSVMLPVSNNDSNDFSIIKINEKSFEAILFDENYYIINKIESNIPQDLISFLAAIKIKSITRLFFSSYQGIGYLDIDFLSGVVSETFVNTNVEQNEKVIAYYNENSKFYLVTLNDDSIIKIFSFSENEKFDLIEFSKESQKIYEVQLYYKLFKTGEVISIIKSNEQPSLTLTYNTKKVYVSEDNISITVDESPSNTIIVSINLNDKSLEVYNVQAPKLNVGDLSKSKIIVHSYLKDNNLFQLSTNKEFAQLQVVDFKNDTILKTIKIDDIYSNSLNPPTKQTIPEFGNNESELLKNKNQFYKNIYSKKAGVVVFVDGDDYIINIGALGIPARNKRLHYEYQNNMTGGFTPYTTGSSYVNGSLYISVSFISLPGVIANPPNYGETNSIYQNEKITTEFISTIRLNKHNFEKVTNNNFSSIYHKTRKYEQELRKNRIRLVKPSLYKIKDQYYFSYFSLKERSFIISKIE